MDKTLAKTLRQRNQEMSFMHPAPQLWKALVHKLHQNSEKRTIPQKSGQGVEHHAAVDTFEKGEKKKHLQKKGTYL